MASIKHNYFNRMLWKGVPVLIVTLLIFFATYLWLAAERSPRYRVVLCGVAALLLSRAMSPQEAWRQINWDTILLLLGMFVLLAVISETGFFRVFGTWLIQRLRGHPTAIFLTLPMLAAVLSMVLNNIAVMIFLSALTVELCRHIPMDPVVLISSEVCAANAGGGATLIGATPNIVMGTSLGYGFNSFLANMGPIACFCVVIQLGVYFLRYKKSLSNTRPGADSFPNQNRALETPIRISCRVVNILLHVDWKTLIFFMGLFVMVGALQKAGLFGRLAQLLLTVHCSPLFLILLFLWMAAFASAIVDNIPMAMSMACLIKEMHGLPGTPPPGILLWSALIGLTIGGNLTPIGASPNVVAYGALEKLNIKVGWRKWAELTAAPTITALAAASVLIWMKYRTGWY